MQIRPVAKPARIRRRHRGLGFSFGLLVVVPVVLFSAYLWLVAEDRYASTTGFSVRRDDGAGASDFLGGLVQLAGGSTGGDQDMLYEFVQSQQLVERIDARVGFLEHYSAYWDIDPLFAVHPDASVEDLVRYWKRAVRISYDRSTGLLNIRVVAFTPQMAQQIAQEVVGESQKMINALNIQAREDSIRYAREELKEAVERLKIAREAMSAFRTRTQIVDPESDIQGRMGVMYNLQQQLAESLIEFDLLHDTASVNDPRLQQTQRSIDSIRERITLERQSFASGSLITSEGEENYPSLIAEYEGLVVDRLFAEETYRAALAALDLARAQATRQSRYLAVYIEPTFAQTSKYPDRFTTTGLLALFLLLLWGILALVYYSIRDRR